MDSTGKKQGPKAATPDYGLDLSMLPAKRDYRRIDAFLREYVRVPRGVGAGDPLVLRRWQLNDVVKVGFPPTGRRPRQLVVSLPRGNGKSALAAGLAVYGLFADEVESPQVLLVASDERQARIVFNLARRMIQMDPRLAEQVHFYSDRIVLPRTDGVLMPLPAEPAALQGWDPTLTVVDELHVVTEPVWEAMALTAGKRPESLTLAISTPADSLDSVMWKLVDHGRSNPDDKGFRLVEYAAPDNCAVDDMDALKKANPALGDFLAVDGVLATLKTSREESWRRYRLGQWVGAADAWLPWGLWESRESDAGLPADGAPVALAFDGSASGDSTALVGCTVDRPHHLFVVGLWEAPANDQRWRVPRGEVAGMVEAAFDRWNVVELAADPWGWRTDLEQWAAKFGSAVTEWNTGHAARMAPATDRLYTALSEGRVTQDGDPRLAEHVGHAIAKRTPMGDLVAKDKRGSPRKIDACVAAIVAHDRAAWHASQPTKRRRVIAHS